MSSIASNDSRTASIASLTAGTGFLRNMPSRSVRLHRAEAQEYCRRLARSHYENFSVATWFLPKRLRQHFFNVYAYCRISDDLGDEVGDPEASLQCSTSGRRNSMPATPARRGIPCSSRCERQCANLIFRKQPFDDLLKAFRQDQTVTRYETFEDLLGYCRYSANPVGHLVLYLCGYRDADRQALSDFTCTALQLANFWQDVSDDYAKGRIYLPLEDLRRYGVSEDDISAARNTPAFCDMMRFEVERAREWFERGSAPGQSRWIANWRSISNCSAAAGRKF